MTQAPHEDLWQVAVAPGDTRTMTLEQLDAAFEAGLVSETTLIAEAGSSDWEPLYVVAGLEPPEQEPAPALQPSIPQPQVPRPAVPHPAAPRTAVPHPRVPSPPTSVEPSTLPHPAPRPPRGPSRVPRPTPTPPPPIQRPAGRQRSGTMPGPGVVPIATKTPSMMETAAAVVAETGTATKPTPSKAPPLPANAFAHLAQEALAQGKPSAPLPMPSQPPAPPPLPASAHPPAVPPANALAFPLVGGLPPAATAPAPSTAPVSRSMAPPLPVDAFAHLSAAPAAPNVTPESAPEEVSASGNRTLEWLILAAAAFAGLLVIGHRSGVLFGLSEGLGAQSTYLSLEKSLLGEPSVNTPRGVEQLVERVSAEKSAAAASNAAK